MNPNALLAEVAPQAVEIRSQLAEGPFRVTITEVHERDRGQVDLGPLELADRRPQDLSTLSNGSLIGELDDGVAHVPKLGGRV